MIDEAQDLLTPDNIDAFDLMLGIAGHQSRALAHLLRPVAEHLRHRRAGACGEASCAKHSLPSTTCSRTAETPGRWPCRHRSSPASIWRSTAPPMGRSARTSTTVTASIFVAKLEAVVARLLKQDVRPQDIAVLSTRKRENSLVAGMDELAGVPLVDAGTLRARATMIFSTMHAFKGLERLVVLAIDMEGIGNPERSMLHYAGLSRARGLLNTFLPESERGPYGHQAAAFGARMAGVTPPANQPESSSMSESRFFEKPILNSPYEYPARHWELDASGQPTHRIVESHRRAEFITPIPKAKKQRAAPKQDSLLFDEGHSFLNETRFRRRVVCRKAFWCCAEARLVSLVASRVPA